MAKLKIIKNIIDKNTGNPVREGTVLHINNQKRTKELLEAKVAIEINEGDAHEK